MTFPTAQGFFKCSVASSTNAPLEWESATVESSSAPPGTSFSFRSTSVGNDNFNNTAFLQGTVSSAGTYAWAFVLTGGPYTSRRSGEIVIGAFVPPPNAPTISPVPNFVWTVGQSVTGLGFPGGTGGRAPLSNTLIGSLPAGVSYSIVGGDFRFAGTPTATQAAREYTARVTDANNLSDRETFTIRVVSPPVSAGTTPVTRISTATTPVRRISQGTTLLWSR